MPEFIFLADASQIRVLRLRHWTGGKVSVKLAIGVFAGELIRVSIILMHFLSKVNAKLGINYKRHVKCDRICTWLCVLSLQLFFLTFINCSIDRHSSRKQQILHVRCFCLLRLPSVFELSPFPLIKHFFFCKVKTIVCSLGVKRVIFPYSKYC